MNDTTIRIMGGIYFALCSALSDQGVELANDILSRLADDPQTAAPEVFVYRLIAQSASREKRPHLELVANN
jgi:hypothetical protein